MSTLKIEKSHLSTLEPYSLQQVLENLNNKAPEKSLTIPKLKIEINLLKQEVKMIKRKLVVIKSIPKCTLTTSFIVREEDYSSKAEEFFFINLIDNVIYQKWFVNITIVVDIDFVFKDIALIDRRADMNYLRKMLIPTHYFNKTSLTLISSGGFKLKIKFKLSKAYICNKGICMQNTFIMIKNLL